MRKGGMEGGEEGDVWRSEEGEVCHEEFFTLSS